MVLSNPFLAVLALTAGLMLAVPPALAQPRTPSGAVSVAQVLTAVARAPREAGARELLAAYVSGLAEGLVAANRLAEARGKGRLFCAGPVRLDGATLSAVLTAAVPDAAQRARVAATPILVNHLAGRTC